jgi:hypothetical protein
MSDSPHGKLPISPIKLPFSPTSPAEPPPSACA